MYCEKCGKKVEEDSVFCPYCGAFLGEEEMETHTEKSKEEDIEKDIIREQPKKGGKRTKVLLAVAALALVCGLAGIGAYKLGGKGGTLFFGKEGKKIDVTDNKAILKKIRKESICAQVGDNDWEIRDIYENVIADGFTYMAPAAGKEKSVFIVAKGEEEKQRWGIVDGTGKEIVPIKYAYVGFVERMADFERKYFIASETEWSEDGEQQYFGLFDNEGKECLPMVYTNIWQVGKKWMMADNEQDISLINLSSGKTVLSSPRLMDALEDKQGMLRVWMQESGDQMLLQYLDASGKPISDEKYLTGSDFNKKGQAVVLTQSGKWIIIDKKGKTVKETEYTQEDFTEITTFGVADVVGICETDEEDGKEGFLTADGERLGGFYDRVGEVCYGKEKPKLLPVCKYGSENEDGGMEEYWGFLNRDGEVEVDLQYSSVQYQKNGLFSVWKDGICGFMKENGEMAGNLGYANNTSGFTMSDDWAIVYESESGENERCCIMDKKGNQKGDWYSIMTSPQGFSESSQSLAVQTVEERKSAEKEEDGFIIATFIKTIVYINPNTGKALTNPIERMVTRVVGSAFEVERDESADVSTDYADYFYYENWRFPYHMMYPVQFQNVRTNPDNGDGLELQSADEKCFLSMWGTYEILPYDIEEEYNMAKFGEVFFSEIGEDYYTVERQTDSGLVTYLTALNTQRGIILTIQMSYPEDMKDQYFEIGEEMRRDMYAHNVY